MGVFKEEAHAFETIAKRQRQIFTDAADYGVPFKYSNPPKDIKRVFEIINELKHSSFIVRNRQTWKGGTSVDVIFFCEEDGGYGWSTKYHISFSHIPINSSQIEGEYDAMISIDIEPHREKV